MKILFILKETDAFERYGVMSLSAVLKQKGHHVGLIVLERAGIKGCFKSIKKFSPQIIGYSAMTGEYEALLKLNMSLKKRFEFLSVFGGPHVTFDHKSIEDWGVDAICIGEGERSFVNFVEKVNGGKYWKTQGFFVKHKGKIHQNPLEPLIKELDEIPFPDRSLMYKADPELRTGQKIFFASRGCPYICSYCFNNQYNSIFKGKGKILRERSPANLVKEIKEVKERFILDVAWIADDTFLLRNMKWLKTFSELIKKTKMPFVINVRANLVTDENIKVLRDAGLHSVSMGVECGNEEVSKNILQRNLSNEQIFRACKILKKYEVKLVTQNLFGLPVINPYKIDLQTLDVNIKIKPDVMGGNLIYPYPGTPIEKYARGKGFLVGNVKNNETNKRNSLLTFRSKKEKRKSEHLHKLAGLIVEFPSLRPFTNFLVSLPLTKVYTGIYYLWYGYTLKTRMFPIKRSFIKEMFKYAKFWWRLQRKT